MEPTDIALLGLRLWLGAVMVAHGINHGRNLDGTASWFASKGFRYSRMNAMVSWAGEIVIGFGLILGIATSFAAAGLVATMVVAFGAIHRFAGFYVFARPDEGYEYVATLAFAASVLAILGPGTISVDSAIALAADLDGWTGAAIVLGGLLLGMIQLAVFWRRPASQNHTTNRETESAS